MLNVLSTLWMLSPFVLIPAVALLALRCRDLERENARLRAPPPEPIPGGGDARKADASARRAADRYPLSGAARPAAETSASSASSVTPAPSDVPASSAASATSGVPGPAPPWRANDYLRAAADRPGRQEELHPKRPLSGQGTAPEGKGRLPYSGAPAMPYSQSEAGKAAGPDSPASGMRPRPVQLAFILGVLFVLLAGVIFATTTWRYWSGPLRAGLVFAVTALFFGASWFCERRLRLRTTSIAFYALGTLFLPVSMLAAGYFSLFGRWLSLRGPGRPLLGVMAMALAGAACALGARRYRSAPYAAAFYGSVSVGTLYLIRLFHPPADVQALLLALWCAALTGLSLYPPRSLREGAVLRRSWLRSYAALNTLLCGLFILLTLPAGPLPALATVCFSILFLADALYREGSGMQLGGAGAFVLFLAAGAVRLSGGSWDRALLWMGATAAVLLFLSEPDRLPIWVSRGLFAGAGIVGGLTLLCSLGRGVLTGWTLPLLLSLMLLSAAVSAAALLGGKRLWLWLQPVYLLALCIGFCGFLALRPARAGVLLALLSAAAFLLTRAVALPNGARLRTAVSDFLYPICCLLCGGWTLLLPGREYALAALLGLSLFLALVGLLALERPGGLWRNAARWLLPHLPLTLLGPLARLLPGWGPALCCLCFALLGASALALQAAGEGPGRLRTLREPVMLAAAIYSALLPLLLWWIDAGGGAPCLWLAACYWSLRFCFGLAAGEKLRAFPYPAFLALLLAVFETARCWFPDSPITVRLLVCAAVAAALGAMGEAFARDAPDALPDWLLLPFGRALAALACLGALTGLFERGLTPWPLILCAAGCLLAFAALYRRERSPFWQLPPLLFLYPLLWRGLELGAVSSATGCWANLLLFILLAAAGRLLWRGTLSLSGERARMDWLLLLNLCAPAFLRLRGGQYAVVAAWSLLALWCLLFWGRGAGKDWNRAALTGAALCLCIVWWRQPFLSLPDAMRLKWNLLPLVVVPSLCRSLIWRGRAEGATSNIQYAGACFCALCLFGEAAIFGRATDALLLGLLALALLLFSFQARRRRWLVLSAVTLLVLVLDRTRAFWLSLSWWVYLLLAGALLIGYAAACEVFRQKGKDLPGLLGRKLREWRW